MQLSPDFGRAYATLQYVHRTLDWEWGAAEAAERRALALDPNDLWPLIVGGVVAGSLGRWDDVERKLRAALAQAALEMVQQEADEWVRLWFLPVVLRAVGRNEDADEALKALIAGTTPGSGPYFVAMNYAYRGETDLAFEWLERAYRERDFAKRRQTQGYPLIRDEAT